MAMPTFLFADRVALVTGGASGIGRATALQFAAAGASVVLADVDAEGAEETCDAISRLGRTALFLRTDVSQSSACCSMVDTAVRAFGRLDFAFNNAGRLGSNVPLVDLPAAQWQAVVDVNLSGVYNCLQAELRVMQPAGRGAVVNNASVMGLRGGVNCADYTASKHGVVGLTRAAALESGRHGVRVNAICPGFVATAMTQGGDASRDRAVAASVRRSAMRRLGTPEEIAQAVLWLCSDGASFVTGAAIPVDGGFTST